MLTKKYMLDTNAYFKILCFLGGKSDCLDDGSREELNNLLRSNCCISRITLVEIISVIGQYSRGKNNNKRWKRKHTEAWVKLTKDITRQRSPLFSLEIIPFSEAIFTEAESFIKQSLTYNFGSMDAFIASTAVVEKRKGSEVVVITEDKSLKSAMSVTNIEHNDMLKKVIYKQ